MQFEAGPKCAWKHGQGETTRDWTQDMETDALTVPDEDRVTTQKQNHFSGLYGIYWHCFYV